jgi:hypothetical protein
MLEEMAQKFPLFLVIPFDFPHELHECRKKTSDLVEANER